MQIAADAMLWLGAVRQEAVAGRSSTVPDLDTIAGTMLMDSKWRWRPCGASLVVAVALLCAGFAANASEPFAKRTPRYSHEGTSGCMRCHSERHLSSIAAGPHGDADEPGTPMADFGCESCHGPASFHVSRAHGGRGFPPVIRFGSGPDVSPRSVQLEACLDCHAAGAPASTGIIGSAHDRKSINCSTCHRVHESTDPMRDPREQAESCYRCHRAVRSAHPGFGGKPIDVNSRSCSSCHDVHESNG